MVDKDLYLVGADDLILNRCERLYGAAKAYEVPLIEYGRPAEQPEMLPRILFLERSDIPADFKRTDRAKRSTNNLNLRNIPTIC